MIYKREICKYIHMCVCFLYLTLIKNILFQYEADELNAEALKFPLVN